MSGNKSSGEVWVKQRKSYFNRTKSSSLEVENKLMEYFNSGYPVVLSSGRSAISMTFRYFYKGSDVRVFPFASQCVVNSVLAAHLTPSTPLNLSVIDISYNQWGHFNQSLELPPFLEDSVDSFYPIYSEVLRSGADFEVWSLQKIFGLNYGAVLWCKSEKDARKIRNLRDSNTNRIKMLSRMIFRSFKTVHKIIYGLWEKLEHQHLPLSRREYGHVLEEILMWEQTYNERRKFYYEALDSFGLKISVDIEDFRAVIPVVIELPKHIPKANFEGLLELHRIVNVEKASAVSIFPYQVKL
jgi:putative PLP-dependent aminotransferase (TIGR04422 family)